MQSSSLSTVWRNTYGIMFGTTGQTTIPMTAAMQNKVLTQNLKDVRHKLFVMSGKGGVGKTNISVNLA